MVVTAQQRASVFGQPGRVERVNVTTPWGVVTQCHKLIAPMFLAACEEAHRSCSWRPQRIDSYNPRPIRGTNGDRLEEWSLHSWCLAWDFFATPPNVSPPGGVWTPDNGVPVEFAAVFERHGFRWGGRWSSRRDVPHIEWADGRPPTNAAPAPAPTTPNLEEHDVIWNIDGSPYNFLHLGGREFLPLTADTFWKLAGQGVKVVKVSNDLFQSVSPVNGQGSLLHGKAYG